MRLACVLLLAAGCFAQESAEDLIARGNAAASHDDHKAAIQQYEAAIRLAPALRTELLLKLGQQYLWADQPAPAAKLLGEYTAAHPQECGPRATYALALSWSSQLGAAERAYDALQRDCPDRKTDALLGKARVLRWRDRPQAATQTYEEVLRSGDEAQRRDAKIGLALTELAEDQNRQARADLQAALATSPKDAALVEGLAVSQVHLGLPDKARGELQRAEASGVHAPALTRLSEELTERARPAITPDFAVFHDADGTNFYAGEFRGAVALHPRSRLEAYGGASSLEHGATSIAGQYGGGSLDYRFNEDFAVRGEARVSHYRDADFTPFTGELDAILTPRDGSRIDLSLARLTIWDNQAALQHHLTGVFGSAGLDQRLTTSDRLALAFSATSWSDGNRRLIFRVTPSHAFPGTPRLTVSLPLLYQTYDRGFSFGLFSPSSYIELTPLVRVHFRKATVWDFDLGTRAGGQKEASAEWKPLAAFWGSVARDLRHGWGLSLSASRSSSNVVSSTGFSRTSVAFSLTRAF